MRVMPLPVPGQGRLAALVGKLFGTALQEDGTEDLRNRFQDVLRYHFRSKHFFDVQAELPSGYMDWATQPSPWRTYKGAPSIALPHSVLPRPPRPGPAPLCLESLGSFLQLAAGISAWKSYDGVHKWALRVAPSSGNLQTSELHLALPGLEASAASPVSSSSSPRYASGRPGSTGNGRCALAT